MMVGKRNCNLNQCQNEPCEKTQLLPCYKVLHVHHLPSIVKSWELESTAYRLWYALRIPVYHICRYLSNQNTKSKSAGFPALFDILSDFSSVLKFCVFFFFPVPPCDDFRLPYRDFFHERLLNKPDPQPVNQRTAAKYSAYTTD